MTRKGVQLGDSVALEEDIFHNIYRNSRGLSIYESKFSNKEFAGNATMIAENVQELELGLNELSVASRHKGLRINMSKTEALCSNQGDLRQVITKVCAIEEVQSHIYLGQIRS